MDDRTRVGAAVRSARLRRAMSLEVLAGLANGHTKSWLSKVERGLLPLERRQDLIALANALGVSPSDLTGQPYELDEHPGGTGIYAAVSAIRRALLDRPELAGATVDQLAEQVAVLTRRRQGYEVEAAAAMLPAMILQLRALSTAEAVRLRCWVGYETACLLRDLGLGDLSLLVLDRLTADADLLGDPAMRALASTARAHTLSSTQVGAFGAAAYEADTAADEIGAQGGDEALAAVGGLRLAAGFAHSATGDLGAARARLDEASAIANRLEDGSTEVARHSAFGKSNAGLYRVSISIEASDPDSAVRAAAGMDPERLPWASRRASYWSDLGRAHAQLQDDQAAVVALRRAEQIAPLRVRLHPLVRESVAGMVTRARQAAVGRDLRGLAYRMGVPH